MNFTSNPWLVISALHSPTPFTCTVFEGVADSSHKLQANRILLAIVEFLALLVP